MPMQEIGLPVGATALKITANGRDYSILLDTDSFDRAGEDGDIPIIPLCRGCEFVGEVLPGEWKKGWGADIDTFTARIDGGVLELGGLYDGSGADSDGWIDGHHPIPLMDSTVVTVELESPTNDTDDAPGSGDNIKTEFYIRQDKAVNSPDDDDNYLKISIDVTAAGLFMEVIEEIAGTPNTIFDGSTYDDTSNRDDAAEQFTIWRIVFHDAVAGATSPEDVRHIHIYLKQGVDRAGVDAATENELSTSPYAINDYLFDVGYPAYRIYTTDTGYFGDVVDSGYEAISTYLRVDYPSLFSLKYDFVDADVGKGDVELWDGDPDVAASVQVFDEDHMFVNDLYLQNGLIRLHIDEAADNGVIIYWWTGAAWERVNSEYFFFLNTNGLIISYPFITKINHVSPESITVFIRFRFSAVVEDSRYVDVTITLERGNYTHKLSTVTIFPEQAFRFRTLLQTDNRFVYNGDDAIGDVDIAVAGVNVTKTDNFLLGLDDDGKTIIYTLGTDDDTANRQDLAGGLLYLLSFDAHDRPNFWLGVTPFSLVANLFVEAEDGGNDIGTADTVNDANASPPGGAPNTVRLNAGGDYQTPAGEYSTYAFTAGTDLPEGRYLAAIRAARIGADTMEMYVWNDTDDEYRNEENDKVNKVLALNFNGTNYEGVVFDITAADVTGTDTIVIVAEKTTADANEIRIDYMLIVPIGDGESFPQDVAHAAMRNFNKPKRLYVR